MQNEEKQQLDELYLAIVEELAMGKDPSALRQELVEAGLDSELAKSLVNSAKKQQLDELYLAIAEELAMGKDPSALRQELVEAGLNSELAKSLVNSAKKQQLDELYLAIAEELAMGKDPSALRQELVEAGLDSELAKSLVNSANQAINDISPWHSFFYLDEPLQWIRGLIITLTLFTVANIILNLILNIIIQIGVVTTGGRIGDAASLAVSFLIWNMMKDSKSNSFSSGMLFGIAIYACWFVYKLIIEPFI